ncbi:hypothetical protein [Nocardia sp. NPDC050710]|uniref:hypothetical protein n=1 Tax=Nocardia sp. NPDC050710 TaxID=3157220 RepID=UPI0033C8CC89
MAAVRGIYRRNNVHRIEVRAMKDGGYAWARAGFAFDTDSNRLSSSIRSIERRIEAVRGDASPRDQELLRSK